MKRGEIWYVKKMSATETSGQCVIWEGRPAVVVSCNDINNFEKVVEVVMLTTQPKRSTPAHANVRCMGKNGTAVCEQVRSFDSEMLDRYIGEVTPAEMKAIDEALKYSLGIECQCKNNSSTEEVEKLKKDVEFWRKRCADMYVTLTEVSRDVP